MTIFQSIILGLVQGVAEFLPSSSTGHLVILSRIPGWAQQPLVFDTTLHLATAAALVVYFWKEILAIIVAFIKSVFQFKFSYQKYSKEAKLGLVILVGSIPAGIIGVLVGNSIETAFRSVLAVAIFLILGSVLMFFAEKRNSNGVDINMKKGFVIGLFQSLALLPGISRSGSTISGAMFLGLKREEATRISFLLSIPIVLSAGLFQLLKSYSELSTIPFSVTLIGFVVSFLSGIFAIKFLLKFVKTHSLYPFIVYRIALAALLLIVIL
jgi:undecaprenyl-diphosphatase